MNGHPTSAQVDVVSLFNGIAPTLMLFERTMFTIRHLRCQWVTERNVYEVETISAPVNYFASNKLVVDGEGLAGQTHRPCTRGIT